MQAVPFRSLSVAPLRTGSLRQPIVTAALAVLVVAALVVASRIVGVVVGSATTDASLEPVVLISLLGCATLLVLVLTSAYTWLSSGEAR